MVQLQRIGTKTGGRGINRTGEEYPNYSIIENCQNTENSPGGLRRLAVAQTQVKDRQLTLM